MTDIQIVSATLYAGRVYNRRGGIDYCSRLYATREDAAIACFKARRAATRCMTSEAVYNGFWKRRVPTHHGIEWVSRNDVTIPSFTWKENKMRLVFTVALLLVGGVVAYAVVYGPHCPNDFPATRIGTMRISGCER